jgi:hypothetical protein
MAQKVTVTPEDDLDGGPAKETMQFGIDGSDYEIDLSAKNARRFRKQLGQDPSLGYTRHDSAEHLRTGFSTFRWLLEPMLGAAGFAIVTADFTGSVYGAYTCVKA